MRERKNKYLDLFLTFMEIGAFTFGGGYSMIPFIDEICVEKKKWITQEQMGNILVIAESTPGPMAINCSTFVGYLKGGMTGAFLATTGVVLPSFFIILIIAMFLDHFLEIAIVANAFKGIKIAVGILILNAAFNMIRRQKKEMIPQLILYGAAVVMLLINLFSWNFSSISLLLIAGSFTLVLYLIHCFLFQKGGDRL